MNLYDVLANKFDGGSYVDSGSETSYMYSRDQSKF